MDLPWFVEPTFSHLQYIESFECRFESVYLDSGFRVAKDIREDYLVVERAPYEWKE
ncbi:hypothetical protein CK203_030046 [Vitis vinifera]|uniref:Uncharacterized protein n=1 Tax=Vitis vinifera TaxID=29760 RepID=A0A438IK27_VITVI|nr:hypothetical protein CK203_030046 [Vitis vinifera]